jgi:hypothetical protein
MRDGKRSSERETDAECWERMLNLQREYHCYNSARIEAAVEALDMGYNFEQVPIRKILHLGNHVELLLMLNSFKTLFGFVERRIEGTD